MLTNPPRAPVYFLAHRSTTLRRVPPERSSGPRSWLLPCALALLAAAVRWARFQRAAAMMNDGPEFIDLAKQIAAGAWEPVLTHGFHPLYPLLLRAFEALVGDWERAGVVVSVLAGAAAVVLLFRLVEETFDRTSGAIAALLLAAHPIAIEQADVQSDPLYLALFLAAALALWRALARPSAAWAFAAGLASGAAYLARPEGLGGVVVGLALGALALARREWRFTRAARIGAALCVGAALTAGPYVAYLSARTGSLTLTEKKSLASVLSGGTVEARRSKPKDPLLAERPDLAPPERGVSPFRDAPQEKGWRRYTAAVDRLISVTPKALRPEIALLVALGVFALRGRPGARGRFFGTYAVLYLVVLLGLSASSGYVSRRHVLPPGVLLFGYAAAGLLWLAAALARAASGRIAQRRIVALLLALLAGAGVVKSLRADSGNALVKRRAAEWVRAHGGLEPGEAVAAVKRRNAYYAGAPYVDLRRTPHEALFLPYLRRERVRYAIVGEGERAVFERLIAGAPDAPKLVHTERDDGEVAFVYEIAP